MFKKIIYLSLALFMIIFLWTVNSYTEQIKGSTLFEVYLNKNSSECKIVDDSTFNFFVKGKSYIIDKDVDVNYILDFYSAKIVFTETTDFGTNYYAYSGGLKYTKELNNKKINLHIFCSQNKTVIGLPFIYGSY